MTRRKKMMILLLVTLCSTLIAKVNAAQWDVGYITIGGGSVGGGGPVDPNKYYSLYVNDTYNYTEEYTCVYQYKQMYGKQVTINSYDIKEQSLMENTITVNKNNAVIAGTPIGVNMTENLTIGWEVTKVEVQETETRKKRLYSCTYKIKTPPQIISNDSLRLENDKPLPLGLNAKTNVQTIADTYKTIYYRSSYGYSSTWCGANNPDPENYELDSYSTSPVNNTIEYDTYVSIYDNDAYEKECEKIAVEEAINSTNWMFSASYEVKMTDSNDINGSDEVKISIADTNKTIKCKSTTGVPISCRAGVSPFTYTEGVRKEMLKASVTYKKNKVCMNVKTAKVAYRDSSCETNELEVPNKIYNGIEYWNYFIPLNAKSNNGVEVNMIQPNGMHHTKEECNSVMKYYPVTVDYHGNVIEDNSEDPNKLQLTYVNLINPVTPGKTFVGNYCYKYENSDTVNCNENSSDFKEMQNGCYLTSKVRIPVKQKFYKEKPETNNIKFKGFNFYYRPININEPFPNGIVPNSLWTEWNNQTNKKPNINESYEEITYLASKIKSNEVRAYSKNNPYTSWENMNLDGTSQYVTNNNASPIKRISAGNTHKLGCGPANEEEYLDAAHQNKNPLYIKGCDT